MERVGGDERDDHERVGDPPVDGLPVDHDHPPPPPRRRRLLLPRRGIRGHLGSSYDLESPEKKKKTISELLETEAGMNWELLDDAMASSCRCIYKDR